jgi:hypothetical protein
MTDGIVETIVLISLTLVVIMDELVSIDVTVVVVVVDGIVVILCVETLRDVYVFDERIAG